MSQKQTNGDRQLSPQQDNAVAGSSEGPAILRQEELFPAAIHVSESSSFSGPLPPPDLLAEYEAVVPGLADRIVRMAEDEGGHRRKMQRGLLRLSFLGLGSAFIITMTGILGGFYLINGGKSLEGIATFIGALGSLLLVYLSRGKPAPSKPEIGGGKQKLN